MAVWEYLARRCCEVKVVRKLRPRDDMYGGVKYVVWACSVVLVLLVRRVRVSV